jgi:hypothetical protein
MTIEETSESISAELQQNISLANKDIIIQADEIESTESQIPNLEKTNLKESSENKEVDSTMETTNNEEIIELETSPVIIINNENLEMQELDRSEEDYIVATNKRKKDKKKVPIQEPSRVSPYKKKARNEGLNTTI